MCDINDYILNSPIGRLILTVCNKGVHKLNQEGGIGDENFNPNQGVTVTLIDKIRPKDVEIVDQVLYWLKIYFNDVQAINHTFMPSLCPSAGASTNFRTQVCQVLSKNVGPGKTVSYSELASMLNKPNAARAVGTAMANNPIQLIIPCHRVIRNDLSLGNYARGQRVKMWLLKHEGVKLAANNKVLPVPGTKKRPTKTVVLP